MVSALGLVLQGEGAAVEAGFAHMFEVTKRFGSMEAVVARTAGAHPEFVHPVTHVQVVAEFYVRTVLESLNALGIDVTGCKNVDFSFYEDVKVTYLQELKGSIEAQLEVDMGVYRKLLKEFTVTYNALYAAILGKKGEKAIDVAQGRYDAAFSALVEPKKNLMRSRLAEEYVRCAPSAYESGTVEGFIVGFTRILRTDLWNPAAPNNYGDVLHFVYNDLFAVGV